MRQTTDMVTRGTFVDLLLMNQNPIIICPLCNDRVEKLLYNFHLNNERRVIELIKKNNPDWTVDDGACSRCVDYYQVELLMRQRILPEIGPHFPVRSADDFVILPTGLRLKADARFTGKGVTICFIDSGFSLHPDLTTHANRVKIFVDIPNNKSCSPTASFIAPFSTGSGQWHGTMTTVVCAGDGYLSNGLYKGIASSADLVLLKVQGDTGKIDDANIIKALEWILDHHREFRINIVNISLGADETQHGHAEKINSLIEKINEENIMVVAAAGNNEQATLKAPATAPAAISVGGLDDENMLDEKAQKLYHSSFGNAGGEILKPELIAHAAWIAAPLLPGTDEQKEAELLHELLRLEDADLAAAVESTRHRSPKLLAALNTGEAAITRDSIVQRIQQCKYISPHYMHVDGTSFAAPIVTAVIAQMLEADPALTVAMTRSILFSTACRIENLPAERQGFGRIQPHKAVLKTLQRLPAKQLSLAPVISHQQKTINFFVQNEAASQVSLAGTFNDWAKDILLLEAGNNGIWCIEIPMLPEGRHAYKFFVDGRLWIEDVNNPYREPDGFNGFNSILIIEN